MSTTSQDVITEEIAITPGELRRIADLIEAGAGEPVGAAHRKEAAEIRDIAARLDRDGTYSVLRPAVRVTYRIPAH